MNIYTEKTNIVPYTYANNLYITGKAFTFKNWALDTYFC